MAELLQKYHDRFITAIALLPINNPDAALEETDRAINELGFRGIYVNSAMYSGEVSASCFIYKF